MTFQINNIVIAKNLNTKAELNGNYGYIVKCCNNNRYGVIFKGQKKLMSISEKNVELFSEMTFRRDILDEKNVEEEIEKAIDEAVDKFDKNEYFSRGLIQQKMWNQMNLLYSESFLLVCQDDNPDKLVAQELNTQIKASIKGIIQLKLKTFYTSKLLDKYIERSIQKIILDNL